jgi:HEPN domain-containing protein
VAHQVTEKAIKAFIYAQGEEFVIGYSVEALCRMAATFDPDFEILRAAVAPLDGYYLPTRYPDSLPDSIPARIYTRVVAEETLRLTDQALHLLRTKLQRAEPASQ